MTASPQRCACQTIMITVNGGDLCSHCDFSCDINACQQCKNYRTGIALKKSAS